MEKQEENNKIHDNYIKLMDGKNIDKGPIFQPIKSSEELHNTSIHDNYTKLMDGKVVDKGIIFQPNCYSKEVHNSNIHNNYIKLLNSGYKTRSIKSADELKYDDLYNDDGFQR